MLIVPTIESDLPQIQEWINADPDHSRFPDNDPKFLLTGKGALAFCLKDDEGPLCYVRLDEENGMLRLATQFAPEIEVSKKRLVKGLLEMGIPAIIAFAKNTDHKGIVFETMTESLIAFMKKLNFNHTSGDDYALVFEDNDV